MLARNLSLQPPLQPQPQPQQVAVWRKGIALDTVYFKIVLLVQVPNCILGEDVQTSVVLCPNFPSSLSGRSADTAGEKS